MTSISCRGKVYQQGDHVAINSRGKIIGRDGKPTSGSIKQNARAAHFPGRMIEVEGMEHAMAARHDITLPAMRAEVIESVRALADQEYQRRVWIEHEYPSPDYYDDLTLTVTILYDDTTVLADPQAALGRTLANQAEVEAMGRLADALGRALDEVGRDQPDERFVASAVWSSVVDAASAALVVLTADG
ncbi:hypothetical protein [Streptomyces sp. NPDC020362]|uniref:SCO4402 family protein n=1 Tax=unclassified Streptomyces TaxID=2593676 RepID=UPI000A80EEE6